MPSTLTNTIYSFCPRCGVAVATVVSNTQTHMALDTGLPCSTLPGCNWCTPRMQNTVMQAAKETATKLFSALWGSQRGKYQSVSQVSDDDREQIDGLAGRVVRSWSVDKMQSQVQEREVPGGRGGGECIELSELAEERDVFQLRK